MRACVAGVVVGDVADDLRRRDPIGQEREGRRRVVAGLRLEPGPVDRAAVEPRRRAGLQPAQRKPAAARASATGRATAPRRPGRPGSSPRRYGSGRGETCRWSARPARPRAAARRRARPRRPGRARRAADPRPRPRRSRGRASRPSSSAIAPAIELAVGLGARARAPPGPCCGSACGTGCRRGRSPGP